MKENRHSVYSVRARKLQRGQKFCRKYLFARGEGEMNEQNVECLFFVSKASFGGPLQL
jgi:hypothetical protein